MNLYSKLLIVACAISLLLIILMVLFYLSTYHPNQIEPLVVNNSPQAPLLPSGKKIKIMSWNLQYMAGKNYLFYYDEWDGSGPDTQPSKKDIRITLQRAAEIITSENPDILLLQELDVDAEKTYYQDQVAELLQLISKEYGSYTSCWYWRARYVPHPKIMGKVGMKLAIISKYKLASARRHQLPLMPNNYFVRNLNFKRSILETVIPCESGKSISLMSTHMDAFAQGSDTMQRQVAYIKNLLNSFDAEKRSWVIAGDFNLLPPGESYDLLPDDEERYFQKNSEMKLLYDNFLVYPKLSDIEPQTIQRWFTHFPNRQKAPDRIIDYYIVSKNISPIDYYVRQSDTLDISDHLPFIMEITTP